MSKTILLFLLGAAVSFGQTQSSKTASTKQSPRHTATKRTKGAKPVGQPANQVKIPQGAVKTDDGYRYTDKDGKVWMYRETPFGVTKTPEAAAQAEPPPQARATAASVQTASAAPQTEGNIEQVKAVEHGGVIHFEKPVPFGTKKWDKKVSELTTEEQQIWQREQAKRSN